MPIYEYRCQACSHELERLQRLSEPALKECPACGKPKLQRLISAAGFRLKGAGWYETDFKQGSKRNLVDGSGVEGSGGKAEGATAAESAAGSGEKAGKTDSPSSTEPAAKAGSPAGAAAGTTKSAESPAKPKSSGSSAADSA
ncbi:MAG: FmdB family zinc ribbon protein [Lysobacterales bacterium]